MKGRLGLDSLFRTPFCWTPPYFGEMERYGILPAAFDPARDVIDVFQTDQAHWRSFWPTGD